MRLQGLHGPVHRLRGRLEDHRDQPLPLRDYGWGCCRLLVLAERAESQVQALRAGERREGIGFGGCADVY